MKLHHAVRASLADWLMEVSALLAVFPLVDQIVAPGTVRWGLVAGSETVALTFLLIGLNWKRKGTL